MKKVKSAEKIMRSITERYNSVATQSNKNVYFMTNNEASDKESI